jgi:uncharacterized GH25 family protein
LKKIIYSILLSAIAVLNANAHGIWLELDDKKDEAKLYFGEWENGKAEGADKLKRIKGEDVYPKELVKEIIRKDNYISYNLTKKSDFAVIEAGEPRKSKNDDTISRKISYAKAGRINTNSIIAFDVIPVKENSNTFKLVYNNEAMVKTNVTVISPTKWEKTFRTDDKGEFTIHTPWVGKYLIEVSFEDLTKGEVDGKPYDKTVHSLSYMIEVNQGLPWDSKK